MEYVGGVLILVIALLCWLRWPSRFRTVPQQRMDVVERLGKYKRTLSPGLNLLVPFVDAVRTKVDMREQVVSLPAAAGDHLGQPGRLDRHGALLQGGRPGPGHVRDLELPAGHRAAHGHHAA
jgi:hypothetical protein